MQNIDKMSQGARAKAVIYTRVSGAKQVREGDGLASQETRCREYADHRGHDVVQVFRDDISGKLASRPGMQAMLSFLAKNKARGCVVIIDDISRLARGLDAHLELRASLARVNAKLESPSIEFGEDSDSQLVEHLLASVAQHHREKNGEQTKNRMRGRVMNGYWVFKAPPGYRYDRHSGHGKILVRDEPLASIIQEALEGFASGRFESQVEVKRFLESQPCFPKDLPHGEIRHQRVTDILTRAVYAGYVEAPNWNVARRKGHHEGLIDLNTFQRNQDRRTGRAKAPTRKDLNADFPLRGFVNCADCGAPYTACWSTSKTGTKHPYYLCYTKTCSSHRKSIRRDDIEGAFAETLQGLHPSAAMFDLVRAMFKDAWGQRQSQTDTTKATLQSEIVAKDKAIAGLIDRLMEASSQSVVKAYEARVEKLEQEKLVLSENLKGKTAPVGSFEELFELAMRFLSNPWKLWSSGQFVLQRIVLRLAFEDRLTYDRKSGLRTPQVSVPFQFLGDLTVNCKMVPPERLELPTS